MNSVPTLYLRIDLAAAIYDDVNGVLRYEGDVALATGTSGYLDGHLHVLLDWQGKGRG